MKAICFFFAGVFCFATIHTLRAQVKVSDLMPLDQGRYVEYAEQDTVSTQVLNRYSSYTVIQSGISYADSTGVSTVLDSSSWDRAHDTGTITTLHYRFTNSGDLQVYADRGLMQQVLGPKLAPGATPPNIWLTELKTSAGAGVEYTIDTLNSSYLGLQVKVVFTGTYMGPVSVTTPGVPNGVTAQWFNLTGHVSIPAVAVQFSSTQTDYLASGIGIVKTNFPRIFTNLGILIDTSGGTKKEMTAYGVAPSAVSEPNSESSSSIQFFPNPASENLTVSFDRPARRVLLYDATGRMVRSFDLATNTGNALLWVKDIPDGVYLARVQFANGTNASKKLVIQH